MINYYTNIFFDENNDDEMITDNLKVNLIYILTFFDETIINNNLNLIKKIKKYANNLNNEKQFDINDLDDKYLSLYLKKITEYENSHIYKIHEVLGGKSGIKNHKYGLLNSSIFDLAKFNFNDDNYDQMKYYLNLLIEKNDLEAILFMALFCKYFEKNKIDEEKYYLKIHNFVNNKIGIENSDCYDISQFMRIYVEAMYFLSIYYLENNESDKCSYVSLEIIKFIEFHHMIDYIDGSLEDQINGGEYLISNQYFNLNLSMFYMYLKLYDNLINTCDSYDNNLYVNKYKNEIEFIINNWK